MNWIEADPLPRECVGCREKDCYNCDTAGERWTLSRADELRIRRKALCKAMERLQKDLAEIDRELCLLEK